MRKNRGVSRLMSLTPLTPLTPQLAKVELTNLTFPPFLNTEGAEDTEK